MTLEGLPPSGANSKLYHYKKEVREMTDIPETRFFRENKLKVSEEEKRTQTIFSAFQKPSAIQGRRWRQLNKAFVNSKKQNKQDSKKSIQIETVGTLQDWV